MGYRWRGSGVQVGEKWEKGGGGGGGIYSATVEPNADTLGMEESVLIIEVS